MDYKNTYVMYDSKLLYDYYIIVDVDNPISRKIFKENGISVIFFDRFDSDDTEYTLYKCKTLKRNREIFDKCIEKLCNNMLIFGKRDYIEFSSELLARVFGDFNDIILECTGLLNRSYIVKVDADNINHKEFAFVPDRCNNATFQYVSDRVKHVIDVNKLGYNRLTISVRNMHSGEEKIFNYINE